MKSCYLIKKLLNYLFQFYLQKNLCNIKIIFLKEDKNFFIDIYFNYENYNF